MRRSCRWADNNVVVPTGNFGNILASYYAKRMGLPVHKFICASNSNNVLTDFIRTGTYDKKRAFYTTISPSMDILVSSNLERLLYHLCGEDTEKLTGWMNALQSGGAYTVDAVTADAVRALFYGGCCDDKETVEVIRNTFEKDGYLCDTHTAVAVGVYEQYLKETGDNTPPSLLPLQARINSRTACSTRSIAKSLQIRLWRPSCSRSFQTQRSLRQSQR